MLRSITSTLAIAVALLMVGCESTDLGSLNPSDFDNPDAIHGSGDSVVESRAVARFDRVALFGEGHVILEQGAEEMLTVETDDNLMGYIETEVVGGVLEIRTQSGVDIEPSDSVTYRLAMIDVAGIQLAGVGSIEIGPIATKDLDLDLGGVGDIVVEQIDVDTLAVEFHGVGTVRIDGGATSEATVNASGIGGYEAPDLRCETASADVSGTGSAILWVTQTLDVTVDGTGSVEYYGSPTVASETNDLGKIIALGDK